MRASFVRPVQIKSDADALCITFRSTFYSWAFKLRVEEIRPPCANRVSLHNWQTDQSEIVFASKSNFATNSFTFQFEFKWINLKLNWRFHWIQNFVPNKFVVLFCSGMKRMLERQGKTWTSDNLRECVCKFIVRLNFEPRADNFGN